MKSVQTSRQVLKKPSDSIEKVIINLFLYLLKILQRQSIKNVFWNHFELLLAKVFSHLEKINLISLGINLCKIINLIMFEKRYLIG